MIQIPKNFPPIRVVTKPSASDGATGEANPAPVHEAPSLSLAEATELLDWLENHEIRPSQVEMDPTGRVTVRWVG